MGSRTNARRIVTVVVGGLATAVAVTSVAMAAMYGSGSIINNSLGSIDIKNDSLRSIDIKQGTISPGDLSTSAKSNGFTPVVENVNDVADGTPTTSTLTCPAGKAFAGGGAFYYLDTDNDNTPDAGEVTVTDASINAVRWLNAGSVALSGTHNVGGAQGDFFAWIHCATA